MYLFAYYVMAQSMFYLTTFFTMSRCNHRVTGVCPMLVSETEEFVPLSQPMRVPMPPPTTMPPAYRMPPPMPPPTGTGVDQWEADFNIFLKIAPNIGGTCSGCLPDNACCQCNLLYQKVERIFNAGWTYGMSKQYKKSSLRVIFADISNWRRVQEACGLLVGSTSDAEASLRMSNGNCVSTTVNNWLTTFCCTTARTLGTKPCLCKPCEDSDWCQPCHDLYETVQNKGNASTGIAKKYFKAAMYDKDTFHHIKISAGMVLPMKLPQRSGSCRCSCCSSTQGLGGKCSWSSGSCG